MRFVKMHGAGNDYVYVNGFQETVPDPAQTARRVSDRRFGVGGDGLILVLPPEAGGDVRMRIFNADGSEAEMCGNGVRCVAKLAADRGLASGDTVRVETLAGTREIALQRENGRVTGGTVAMGRPILKPADIPVLAEGDRAVEVPLDIGGETLRMTCVSMGNPHAVFFADDARGWPLDRLGPQIETHPRFPSRVNVHVAQVVSSEEVMARTWERGSGPTLACGTGMCAVGVAGVLTGRTGRHVLVHAPGGDLEVDWPAADAEVRLTGPAEEVFTGEWPE